MIVICKQLCLGYDHSKDPNVWLQWFNELSDEESDAEDKSDEDEIYDPEENVNESLHNSCSEEEASENSGDEHIRDMNESETRNKTYF